MNEFNLNQNNTTNLNQNNPEEELQKQILQLEAIIKIKMTKEALSRYGNIKTAFPEKAVNLLLILNQYLQTGKIDIIDDNLLKSILIHMNSLENKRDFHITRK